ILTLRTTITYVLFYSLLLRPPSSTLFPYTTLFRSQSVHVELRSAAQCGAASRAGSQEQLLAVQGLNRYPRPSRQVPNWYSRVRQDRKSTRLNSSHVKISYAVFCLKKRNKKIFIVVR